MKQYKHFIVGILLVIFMSVTAAYAAQSVRIIPKPIQKILYDDDKTTNSKEYVGWAPVGTATSASSWKIMRITYSGNDFTVEFADGDALYNNSWDNRATTQTYK